MASDEWSTQGGQNGRPIKWSSQLSGPATVGQPSGPTTGVQTSGPVTRVVQLAANYPSALDVHEWTGGPVTRGDEWPVTSGPHKEARTEGQSSGPAN